MNIGTVIEATLRTEDLIPAFVRELESQKDLTPEHRVLVDEIKARMEAEDYFDSEEAEYDLNEGLFDALQDYAPAYFYFGSHPGDGADFGYWLSEGFEYDFDGLKVDDTSEVPEDYSGEVLHVNDHGNVTLYTADNGALTEVWALV